MAPYLGVMRSMKVGDMHAIVDFLNEAMQEAEDAKRKAEDDFLAKKMDVVARLPARLFHSPLVFGFPTCLTSGGGNRARTDERQDAVSVAP